MRKINKFFLFIFLFILPHFSSASRSAFQPPQIKSSSPPMTVPAPAEPPCRQLLVAVPLESAPLPQPVAPFSREEAVELLSFIIFDHPLQYEIVDRKTTTNEGLRTLFHAVTGFSMPPQQSYGLGMSDPTGYYKLVGAPIRFRHLRSSRDPSAVKRRRENLREAMDPLKYAHWTETDRLRIVGQILKEIIYSYWTISDSYQTSPQVLFPDLRIRLASGYDKHTFDIMTEHFSVLRSDEIAWLRSFTRENHASLDFSSAGEMEVRFIPSSQQGKYDRTNIKLVRDWLLYFLPEVLQLREQILIDARGDVGEHRVALTQNRELKIFLREQILNWYHGNYTMPKRPLDRKDLPSAVNVYLPALKETDPAEILSRVRTSKAELEGQVEMSALHQSRRLVRLMDDLLASLPAPADLTRLQDLTAQAEGLSRWDEGLLNAIDQYLLRANRDLEYLQETFVEAQDLNRLATNLEAPSAVEITEFRMNELNFTQGIAVLKIRLDRQQEWQASLLNLQMLARQYLRQEALGEDTSRIKSQLIRALKEKTIKARPEPKPAPINIGGGSIIKPLPQNNLPKSAP